MKNCLLILLCAVAFCVGCKHKNYIPAVTDVITLSLESKDDNLISKFIDSVSYVCLEEKEGFYFSYIYKLKIHGDYIYVLDDLMSRNSLLRFDRSGKFDRSISRRGNGPQEYVNLRDFCVTSSNIYLYDGQKSKVLIYDLDCNFLSEHTLPFNADAMMALDNNKYLFSLMLSNTRDKLVITDSEFNIETVLLSFSEDFMDNKFTNNIFQEVGDRIIYNKPVNDTIYTISRLGELGKTYYVDFKSNKVPTEIADDYQLISDNRETKSYQYFYDTPIIVDSLMVGLIYNSSTKAALSVDVNNNSYTISNFEPNSVDFDKTVLFPLYATDEYIVGYFDIQVYDFLRVKPNLSPDMIEKMKNGDRIICFYHLTKNL